MMLNPSRPLPVCLPPQPDELLSSWIGRNAAFYGVPPLVLLQHAAPHVPSIHAADHHLTRGQARSLAAAFRTSAGTVHDMTFAAVPKATRPLISARPVHSCRICAKPDGAAEAVTRGQLQGWRITCRTCGGRLEDLEKPAAVSTSEKHAIAAALVGQGLIDAEARSRKRFWISPALVARLLLARRVVRRPSEHGDYRRARILGLIIPEFDRIALQAAHDITKAGRLVVPLCLRPTLLAGVAIVMKAGPEVLNKFHPQAIGATRNCLEALFAENTAQWTPVRTHSQLQLI
jgi:TniQ